MMPRAVAVAIIVPLLVGLAAGDVISEPAPTLAVVAPVPATAPCAAALESTETQAIGAFVPQCDEGGGYEPRQCSGSTGYCWCVDAEGTAISDVNVTRNFRPCSTLPCNMIAQFVSE